MVVAGRTSSWSWMLAPSCYCSCREIGVTALVRKSRCGLVHAPPARDRPCILSARYFGTRPSSLLLCSRDRCYRWPFPLLRQHRPWSLTDRHHPHKCLTQVSPRTNVGLEVVAPATILRTIHRFDFRRLPSWCSTERPPATRSMGEHVGKYTQSSCLASASGFRAERASSLPVEEGKG